MWESISFLFAMILVITILNCAIFGLFYSILIRITSRAARLIIPALVMLAGYLLMMKADPANLIIGAHFFVAPMAVLLSVVFIPGLADPATDLTRILIGNFFVSVIAVVMWGLVLASEFLNTLQYYQNLPLSNGITYACVIVFDIVLAVIIFKRLRGGRRYPVRVRKESE